MKDSIQKILKTRKKHSVTLKDFRASAVLVPFFLKEKEPYLLFTVRNFKVRHHKGEVCFPGGTSDKKDPDLKHTALRECEEEIGISSKDIEILGELDDFVTPTFYRITPFVGKIPYPYSLQINFHEIADVLEVPLSCFMDETKLRIEHFDLFGESVEIPFYSWKDHTIWGATARIVRQLVGLVKT